MIDRPERPLHEVLHDAFGFMVHDPSRLWRDMTTMRECIVTSLYHRSDKAVAQEVEFFLAWAVSRDWPNRWRGLRLDRIEARLRLMLLHQFHELRHHLTQEVFDFITCADIPDSHWGVDVRQIPMRPNERDLFRLSVPGDDFNLGTAFIIQMLDEARPHHQRVLTGEFIMDRVPLAQIDQRYAYDHLRLVIRPDGMLISLVASDGRFAPFVFTATDDVNLFFDMMMGADIYLNVLFASIWRDACVVRSKFVTERQRGDYRPREKRSKRRNPVVLPRTVRHVAWSSDSERAGIIHARHSVRGHYRHLGDGRSASDVAKERAESYGWPAPPDGWTFVEPHLRGHGDPVERPPVERVVCKGLQTAKVVLG